MRFVFIDWLSLHKRLFLLEVVRILNHLLVLGCHFGDCGAVSFILWFFEDRERLFELIERLIGVRLHVNCFRMFKINIIYNLEISDDLFICLFYN